MLRRFFGNLILGMVLSVIGAFIMAVIALIANLPRIIQGVIWLLQQVLRVSYELYLMAISNLRQPLMDLAGFDVLSPSIRTIACLLFSEAIGAGILWLLNWQIGFVWLAIFATHGLVVGYFWAQLLHPGEFQLGNPVER